jgi:hypothetical protein
MIAAENAQPLTAQVLLTGQGPEVSGAIAQCLLSAEADGNLGALDRLPKLTREAALHEVAAAAAGLLDVSLIGVLVAGWREHHDLTSAARRTLALPGSTELVRLVTHQVTATQDPFVTVLVDGHRVATVHLGLSLVFDVAGLLAGVSAGRLVAVHAGRCDITATLAIEGTDVLTRQAHLDLPGVIPLSPGIRLLSAHDYPASEEQARAADEDPTQQRIVPSAG